MFMTAPLAEDGFPLQTAMHFWGSAWPGLPASELLMQLSSALAAVRVGLSAHQLYYGPGIYRDETSSRIEETALMLARLGSRVRRPTKLTLPLRNKGPIASHAKNGASRPTDT